MGTRDFDRMAKAVQTFRVNLTALHAAAEKAREALKPLAEPDWIVIRVPDTHPDSPFREYDGLWVDRRRFVFEEATPFEGDTEALPRPLFPLLVPTARFETDPHFGDVAQVYEPQS
ncbi:hypothetical protein ACFY19_20825 [Streptosporangium saharense]|uniref:hypothetical protein n=1 Tax=Streptosporangium saharense TaxID=1706840 RepID=UPI003675D376